MSVSNMRLFILVRFCVVTSMSIFSISRNTWLVFAIIFLSLLEFSRAISASLVQMNWIPKMPTYEEQNGGSNFSVNINNS